MGYLSSLSPYYRAGVGEAMGAAYRPAMMQFDGSTGYYSKASVSTSGNKLTLICRINRESFTGDSYEYLCRMGATDTRLQMFMYSSDYSTVTTRQDRIRISVLGSGGSGCDLFADGYLDGENHTLFFSYDGDNGTVVFKIDGVDADETGNAERVAPTTMTLYSGSHTLGIGAKGTTSTAPYGGKIGFFGYDDQYLTNWSDFMHINGNLIKQDETTWANSGWGSQPLFWNEHGFMEDNRGSAGDMTNNGTINIADTEILA